MSWPDAGQRARLAGSASRSARLDSTLAASRLYSSLARSSRANIDWNGIRGSPERRATLDTHLESETLRVLKRGPLGPYANNGFVLVDKASSQSAIIDAVAEIDQVIEAAAGTDLRFVLFTHAHVDHVWSFDALKQATAAPFHMHAAEPNVDHSRIDVHLQGGETLQLGSTALRVIHTPGHTPGSLCYHAPSLCVVGDTLFPGGPGRSGSAEELQTMIRSIREKLFALPDETVLLPGHGDNGTIAQSQAEYAGFAEREHDPDLHGDVLWSRD